MSQPVIASDDAVVIPSTRAQIFSGVRVMLHTAVIVALLLMLLGVGQVLAVIVGLIAGLAPASHSRRIGVRFAGTGVRVTNYFREYRIEDLDGVVAHFYLRNRIEFETEGDGRVHVQAGTFWNETQVNQFIDAVEARKGTITSVATS